MNPHPLTVNPHPLTVNPHPLTVKPPPTDSEASTHWQWNPTYWQSNPSYWLNPHPLTETLFTDSETSTYWQWNPHLLTVKPQLLTETPPIDWNPVYWQWHSNNNNNNNKTSQDENEKLWPKTRYVTHEAISSVLTVCCVTFCPFSLCFARRRFSHWPGWFPYGHYIRRQRTGEFATCIRKRFRYGQDLNLGPSESWSDSSMELDTVQY